MSEHHNLSMEDFDAGVQSLAKRHPMLAAMVLRQLNVTIMAVVAGVYWDHHIHMPGCVGYSPTTTGVILNLQPFGLIICRLGDNHLLCGSCVFKPSIVTRTTCLHVPIQDEMLMAMLIGAVASGSVDAGLDHIVSITNRPPSAETSVLIMNACSTVMYCINRLISDKTTNDQFCEQLGLLSGAQPGTYKLPQSAFHNYNACLVLDGALVDGSNKSTNDTTTVVYQSLTASFLVHVPTSFTTPQLLGQLRHLSGFTRDQSMGVAFARERCLQEHDWGCHMVYINETPVRSPFFVFNDRYATLVHQVFSPIFPRELQQLVIEYGAPKPHQAQQALDVAASQHTITDKTISVIMGHCDDSVQFFTEFPTLAQVTRIIVQKELRVFPSTTLNTRYGPGERLTKDIDGFDSLQQLLLLLSCCYVQVNIGDDEYQFETVHRLYELGLDTTELMYRCLSRVAESRQADDLYTLGHQFDYLGPGADLIQLFTANELNEARITIHCHISSQCNFHTADDTVAAQLRTIVADTRMSEYMHQLGCRRDTVILRWGHNEFRNIVVDTDNQQHHMLTRVMAWAKDHVDSNCSYFDQMTDVLSIPLWDCVFPLHPIDHQSVLHVLLPAPYSMLFAYGELVVSTAIDFGLGPSGNGIVMDTACVDNLVSIDSDAMHCLPVPKSNLVESCFQVGLQPRVIFRPQASHVFTFMDRVFPTGDVHLVMDPRQPIRPRALAALVEQIFHSAASCAVRAWLVDGKHTRLHVPEFLPSYHILHNRSFLVGSLFMVPNPAMVDALFSRLGIVKDEAHASPTIDRNAAIVGDGELAGIIKQLPRCLMTTEWVDVVISVLPTARFALVRLALYIVAGSCRCRSCATVRPDEHFLVPPNLERWIQREELVYSIDSGLSRHIDGGGDLKSADTPNVFAAATIRQPWTQFCDACNDHVVAAMNVFYHDLYRGCLRPQGIRFFTSSTNDRQYYFEDESFVFHTSDTFTWRKLRFVCKNDSNPVKKQRSE